LLRAGNNGDMSVSSELAALAFVQAICTHNVNALIKLVHDDHVFIDSLGAAVRGKAAMRKGWEGYFRMVPDYTLTVEEVYSSGDRVIMLGSAHGTYTTDGNLLAESAWKTPAALRAVVEDGKVKEWRVYADNEPIRQLTSKNRAQQ
jgi:ketosteroid isomerase-like protein